MVPVAVSSTTDAAVTGVRAGDGPVTVNVVALIVVGSIRNPDGTVNVALTAVLDTRLIYPRRGWWISP